MAGHEKQQRGCSNPGAKQAAPTTLAHPLQAAGSEAGEVFDPTALGRRPSLLVGETSRVGSDPLFVLCRAPLVRKGHGEGENQLATQKLLPGNHKLI